MAIDRDAESTFADAPRHVLDEIAQFVEQERRRQFIEEARERLPGGSIMAAYIQMRRAGNVEPETDWQGLFDKVMGGDE